MEANLTVNQLAEAHLVNVQREIAGLNEQKNKIEGEIKRLTEYFNNGLSALRDSQKQPDVTEAFKGE